MKIAIASDHGGFLYKQKLVKYLQGKGYDVHDFGTDCEDSCDYPDFALPAAEAVAAGLDWSLYTAQHEHEEGCGCGHDHDHGDHECCHGEGHHHDGDHCCGHHGE